MDWDLDGQVLAFVHELDKCAGRSSCFIHAPSAHPMDSWPRRMVAFYHGNYGARMCAHWVAHPDPDDAAFRKAPVPPYWHDDCDGCCGAVMPEGCIDAPFHGHYLRCIVPSSTSNNVQEDNR